MRKIPTRNYLIAVIVMILTLILTVVLAKFYYDSTHPTDENYLEFLSEVKPEELDNYLVENHDIMIYVTDSETTDKKIDFQVKKILTKNDYIKDVVYLNLNGLDEDFYNKFSSKYNINSSSIVNNTLIIIKEEQVKKVINLNDNNVKQIHKYIDVFFGD